MSNNKRLPEFVLFGDSLTEWSFRATTQGFGLFLTDAYKEKVIILNEDNKQLPEFVLFGASMVQWSFKEKTEGLGWFLTKTYAGKANVLNEGQAGYTSTHLKHDFERIITRATAASAPKTLLFTIFVGANDAAIIGDKEYVPFPTYAANVRAFVEEILVQDAMADTKIVLITPPPINGPVEDQDKVKYMSREEIEDANAWKKELPRYKSYMSKKRYAEGIMAIAKEYEETGRVVGLDYWNKLIDAGIAETVNDEDADQDAELKRLLGCGLIGSKSFGDGWFTDGLHLDKKGYNVLSNALMEILKSKWPELAPENL